MQQILFTLSCLILASCASISELAEPVTEKLTSLPAQNLEPGECGLFVWTSGAERRFILFSQTGTGAGVWFSEGAIQNLSIGSQSGLLANGQFPKTTYVTPEGTNLSASLEDREAITDGTRFKSGTLKITAKDTWERVTPIVGLSACQAR